VKHSTAISNKLSAKAVEAMWSRETLASAKLEWREASIGVS
jgi:hypothetical protein